MVHEGSDPRRAVNQLGRGDDVLHPAVLHLRQEAESGDLRVRHPAQEEDQRRSILPLMSWTVETGVNYSASIRRRDNNNNNNNEDEAPHQF